MLVVDDHALLAQTVATSLHAFGFDVTACGPPGADVVALADSWRPQVVLLDLALGDEDGTDLVAPLVARGARVVAVSGTQEWVDFAAAVAAGATGYLSKAAPFADLVAAVRTAAGGGSLLPVGERERLLASAERPLRVRRDARTRMRQLTPAERRVLDLLAGGRRVPEIAADLVVSVTTVRAHVRALHSKLGVTSQLAAVALARAAGTPPTRAGRQSGP